jgi:hypothetical protein
MQAFSNKLNSSFESCCHKVGYYAGKYAITTLIVTVGLGILLGLGLSNYELETEVFDLWIEPGSALSRESVFLKEHYAAVIKRTEAVLALPKGLPEEQMLTPSRLTEWLEMSERLYTLTYVNSEGKNYTLSDICVRTEVPTQFKSFLTFSGMKGLPCERSTVMDCFFEGAYDFDLKRPLLDLIPLFTNKFLLKPSYHNKTYDELLRIANAGCNMWAELPIPPGFIFGRPTTEPSGFQMLATVLTPEQFAMAECTHPCSQHCFDDYVEPCVNQCLDEGTQCSFACILNQPDPDWIEPCFNHFACIYFCLQVEPCVSDPYGPECAACQNDCRNQTLANPNMTQCVACGDDCTEKGLECSYPCFTVIGGECEDECEANCSMRHITPEQIARAEEIVLGWEGLMIDDMIATKNTYASSQFEFLATRSIDDLVEEAGEGDAVLLVAGYFAMFAYAAICLTKPNNSLESRFMAGLCGIFLVGVSIFGALGFYSGIYEGKFDPTMIQVLPFLALGLGVNNAFVLVSLFQFHPNKSPQQMTAQMLRQGGPSMTLSSMSNFIAFLIGASIPLPAVANFSIAMAFVVLFNYFMVLLAFTAVLSLNSRRMLAGRMDCLCCFRSSGQAGRGEEWGACPDKLANVASTTPAKAFIMAVFVSTFIAAIPGSADLEVGLPLSKLVPLTSYAAPFLAEREAKYDQFDGGLVTGLDQHSSRFVQLDYMSHETLEMLLNLEYDLQQAFGMHQLYTVYSLSWLDNWIKFENCLPECLANNTCAPSCLILDNPRVDYTKPYFYRDRAPFGPDILFHLPNETNMLQNMDAYLNNDGIPFRDQLEREEPGGKILSVRIPYFSQDLPNTEAMIRHIEETRAKCRPYGPVFPSGLVIDFYSQFIGVNEYLTEKLGYMALGIAITAFIFLFNGISAFFMLATVAATLFQIYGFLKYMGILMNGVCVVNLVMAGGVTVEYTAHITRLFQTLQGSRTQRAKDAIKNMTVPLTNSTISTLLGVIPIAFAAFPYFRLYFWSFYLALLFFGFWNGLFVLPTLLSFFGPEPLAANLTDDDHFERLTDGDIKFSKLGGENYPGGTFEDK